MAARPGNRDYGCINKEAVRKRAAILYHILLAAPSTS